MIKNIFLDAEIIQIDDQDNVQGKNLNYQNLYNLVGSKKGIDAHFLQDIKDYVQSSCENTYVLIKENTQDLDSEEWERFISGIPQFWGIGISKE